MNTEEYGCPNCNEASFADMWDLECHMDWCCEAWTDTPEED